MLTEVVEDAGFSGRDLRRPGIIAVLDALGGKRASALMVSKLDRLSRTMYDFAALMDRSTKQGWSLVALDLGVDTTTPAGEAMANVMVSFAQLERRLIAQRTRDALAAKRAAGVRLGRPPVLPAAVLTRIVRERAAGRTLRAIAESLNWAGVPTAHGGRLWYSSTIAGVLRSETGRAVTCAGRGRADARRR